MHKPPTRIYVLQVRFTKDERKRLKQLAAAAVKTVSAYVREKALQS